MKMMPGCSELGFLGTFALDLLLWNFRLGTFAWQHSLASLVLAWNINLERRSDTRIFSLKSFHMELFVREFVLLGSSRSEPLDSNLRPGEPVAVLGGTAIWGTGGRTSHAQPKSLSQNFSRRT